MTKIRAFFYDENYNKIFTFFITVITASICSLSHLHLHFIISISFLPCLYQVIRRLVASFVSLQWVKRVKNFLSIQTDVWLRKGIQSVILKIIVRPWERSSLIKWTLQISMFIWLATMTSASYHLRCQQSRAMPATALISTRDRSNHTRCQRPRVIPARCQRAMATTDDASNKQRQRPWMMPAITHDTAIMQLQWFQ